MSEQEMTGTTGGFLPLEVTVILAIGTYIVANWSDAKKGFADGFLHGYNLIQE